VVAPAMVALDGEKVVPTQNNSNSLKLLERLKLF
jgi:hypothetical protein